MKTRLLLTLIFVLSLAGARVANADTFIPPDEIEFIGLNVYAPTLINDGIYKMWYGGWQSSSDYPNDKIYFRTSTNNSSWSAPITVLWPSLIAPDVIHVNDPSVTKHFNYLSGQWQYTMFYTVCANYCGENQSNNQIWSSVSSDGINWSYHQPLLYGGPAEPSAVYEPEGDGTVWKVYYVDRNDAYNVKMAKVNGNRIYTSFQTVYAYQGLRVISNPEVRQFNGKWQLFFNVNFGNHVDIYKTESLSNVSWTGLGEVIIANPGASQGSNCATIAPGVLPAGGNLYNLYFGLGPSHCIGVCDCDLGNIYFGAISRWLWGD